MELQPPFDSSPANAVSTVRFENENDGWLFNPGLWQTTDGGKQWHRVSLPGKAGVVGALTVADGEVLVSIETANGSSDAAKLYKAAVGSDTWTEVRGVAPANSLTADGHSAWASVAPHMWTTTNSGKTWAKLSFSCPANYSTPSEVAASSPADIAIACSDQGYPQPGFSLKEVFTSATAAAPSTRRGSRRRTARSTCSRWCRATRRC